MSEQPKTIPTARPILLVILLLAAACLSGLVGAAAAVALLRASLTGGAATFEAGLWSAACLSGGLAAAGMLAALAWLIGAQHRAAGVGWQMLSTLKAIMQSQAAEVPIAHAVEDVHSEPPDSQTLAQLLSELRELNATMLMSDKQLQIKRSHRQKLTADALADDIAAATDAERFARAAELLEDLKGQVPDEPRYNQLKDALVQARNKSQAADVAAVKDRAEDLMAVGAFDQAIRVAEELLDKHPAVPEAIGLLDHVKRERDMLMAEQRRGLYAEIERHADKRQWPQAVEAAKKLLAEHAGSDEADAVAAKMSTLEDNARLAEARQLRDSVRDLLNRRRYGEALEVARELTDRFPETQAAAELREQLQRLEELSREQEL